MTAKEAADLTVTEWAEYIGQQQLMDRLFVHIQAALNRDATLDHVLLVGPPGAGKSTLARVIAATLGKPIIDVKMPVDERTLLRMFRVAMDCVVFLDEIHGLNRRMQEMLLPVILEGYVQDRRGRRYPLDNVTVVAATSEREKVIATLYSRFKIKPEFEDYTDEEMAAVVRQMADRAGVSLEDDTIEALARATGGSPRMAGDLVIAARDLAEAGREVEAQSVLTLVAVDEEGLSTLHQRYLAVLSEVGGQAGRSTLEQMLRLPGQTVRELERLLVSRGYVEFSKSGRELTPEGDKKLRALL